MHISYRVKETGEVYDNGFLFANKEVIRQPGSLNVTLNSETIVIHNPRIDVFDTLVRIYWIADLKGAPNFTMKDIYEYFEDKYLQVSPHGRGGLEEIRQIAMQPIALWFSATRALEVLLRRYPEVAQQTEVKLDPPDWAKESLSSWLHGRLTVTKDASDMAQVLACLIVSAQTGVLINDEQFRNILKDPTRNLQRLRQRGAPVD